jgi:Bacterial toxin 50
MMSGTDFIKGVIIGAALGGVINGTIAKVNGLTFWRGTLPKVQVIKLPSPAGLCNVVSTSQEPKVDVKLPKTAEVSTTSTTQANTTNNVTITENVDGSGFKVDGLGIEKQNASIIDIGKQEKHILEHNNYIQGKSILDADAHKLLENVVSGKVNSLEIINSVKTRVDFGKIIGTYIDSNGSAFQTTNAIMINSKTGVHFVPSRP